MPNAKYNFIQKKPENPKHYHVFHFPPNPTKPNIFFYAELLATAFTYLAEI